MMMTRVALVGAILLAASACASQSAAPVPAPQPAPAVAAPSAPVRTVTAEELAFRQALRDVFVATVHSLRAQGMAISWPADLPDDQLLMFADAICNHQAAGLTRDQIVAHMGDVGSMEAGLYIDKANELVCSS